MSKVRDDNVVVCIGRRGSGKSWAVRDLMSRHTSVPSGAVISPTEHANRFFSDFVPSLLIHDEYTPAVIDNVIKRQKKMVNMRRDEESSGIPNPVDPRAFLILDDCNYDKSWLSDPNIRYVFMNGRHIKLFFVVTMQYSLGLPPNLRTNVDYAFIFRETNLQNRKRLYENYAGCVPTFELFGKLLDACTTDNEFLVVDNTTKSNKLSDQIFWCKAGAAGDFKLCAQEYWDLSDQVASRSSTSDEVYDLAKLKKIGSRCKVVKRP